MLAKRSVLVLLGGVLAAILVACGSTLPTATPNPTPTVTDTVPTATPAPTTGGESPTPTPTTEPADEPRNAPLVEPDPDYEEALEDAFFSTDVWETDFSRHTVPYSDITGVLGRDGIPAIDNPKFVTVEEADEVRSFASSARSAPRRSTGRADTAPAKSTEKAMVAEEEGAKDKLARQVLRRYVIEFVSPLPGTRALNRQKR